MWARIKQFFNPLRFSLAMAALMLIFSLVAYKAGLQLEAEIALGGAIFLIWFYLMMRKVWKPLKRVQSYPAIKKGSRNTE